MGEQDINSAEASDLANAMTDYSVDTASTDGATEQKETKWMNTKWTQYLGYYKSIPEYAAVMDAKATWTIGKGFKADEETTLLLDTIKGNGKDTFNSILENLDRTKEIGGDAYAEIIRDDEGNLINLKPLDPETMQHVANSQGMLIRFEQLSKVKGKKPKKYNIEDIFYLARNRIADEIHGNTMTERLVKIILAKNEAMEDWQRVLHRNVDPLLLIKLNTDNTTKIASIKASVDKARAGGENMYIPMDTIEMDALTTAPNSTLNPLPWITMLNDLFYQTAQVPQIIVGGTGSLTEAAVKIAYLAFQQTIEEEQLFLEEQILSQLNLVVELEFPASLENELLSDNKKDGAQNIDPSETTAGKGQ